ncbi:GTP-binding protein, partial [Cytophagia bacterium CHB2]|nr:GTP-binding protein [Cytophagia bacterium CHB2]
MKEFTTDRIRNIALAAHAASGKTSLAEALVYVSGGISRMGSVDEGTSLSDYHSDEINRKNSIITSMLYALWKDHKVNIIDLPGYPDFIGEVRGGMRAADLAVHVLNAQNGVELGAETAWQIAEEYGVPRMFVVNRLDKENANFDKVVEQVREVFGNNVFPVVLPVSPKEYVDLMQMKLVSY